MFRATKIWLCLVVTALIMVAVLQALLSHQANAKQPPPNATPNPTPTQDPNDPEPTIDDSFALIGKQVPEFGGMYVDEENKTLVVNVTQRTLGIIDRLRQAIRDVFPDEELPQNIRLRDASFEFIRLKQWHDNATNVFEIQGVVSSDIDEVENRLVIGVEDEAVRPSVAQVLASAGVPQEGWLLKKVQAPRPGTSLTDLHRPPVGGLQIGIGGGWCTLGFVAIRAGVSGFVTNAHCTNILGSVDGARFAQPADGVSFIATEIVDPPGRTGDACPTICGFGVSPGTCRCRLSDAAFAQYDSGVLRNRALAVPPPGTLAYDGTNLPVVKEGSPIVGLLMRKVGAATGNTMGLITQTCVDIGQNGTRFLFKCQSLTNIPAANGDSGSPVFRPVSCPSSIARPSCARLYGMNWSAGPVVLSPIGKIQRERELGPLTVCVTGEC